MGGAAQDSSRHGGVELDHAGFVAVGHGGVVELDHGGIGELNIAGLIGTGQDGIIEFLCEKGWIEYAKLMEAEVDKIVGPKGKHIPNRRFERNGTAKIRVVIGARIVKKDRPRVCTVPDRVDVPLKTVAAATNRAPITKDIIKQLRAGTSTRRYADTRQWIGSGGDNNWGAGKNAVSDAFIQFCDSRYDELMSRRYESLKLGAMMIDAMDVKGRDMVLALAFTLDGVKVCMGVYDGHTENTELVTGLLADLVDRGLDITQDFLPIIDGSKALHRAIKRVFGNDRIIGRCIRHKIENVIKLLPKKMRKSAQEILEELFSIEDADEAERRIIAYAEELNKSHPSAAASLLEGLDETLILQRMGVPKELWPSLRTTNPVENLIGGLRDLLKRVKRWINGHMALRWLAYALLEKEKTLKRMEGAEYMHLLPGLVAAYRQKLTDPGTMAEQVEAWGAACADPVPVLAPSPVAPVTGGRVRRPPRRPRRQSAEHSAPDVIQLDALTHA